MLNFVKRRRMTIIYSLTYAYIRGACVLLEDSTDNEDNSEKKVRETIQIIGDNAWVKHIMTIILH